MYQCSRYTLTLLAIPEWVIGMVSYGFNRKKTSQKCDTIGMSPHEFAKLEADHPPIIFSSVGSASLN